jgi:cellulose synthase (UDP-forming)
MRAAGIIASWFGILNGSRPVRFPVSVGTIPTGNAIVIAENPGQIPDALLQGGPEISGATVAMRTNPSDPNSSVLLVSGDNPDELVRAASALVLNGNTWQGAQVSIQKLTLPAPLRVNDAPRWLSTERIGNIGQMAQTSGQAGDPTGELQGDGSAPMNLYLRLPPDLDFGDRQNLPFHLSYRYNAVPLASGSTLQVYVNGAFVSATPMPHTDKASAVLETVVPIPVVDLRPFSNTVSLKFMFQVARHGNCENVAPPNLQGSILKDSYLDITGISHSAGLPNLELFANAGYPFTRKADLSDTSVVLPQQPSAGELEMFLTMMGHFGAQTGYPVLNVRVTDPAGISRDSADNYLIMGTVDDQPALKSLNGALPVGVDEEGLHIHDTRGFLDRAAWWRTRGTDAVQGGQPAAGGKPPDALVEEVQWPEGSGRSAVVIVLRTEESIPNFLSAFLKTSQSSDIAESVSVLHNGQFSSYRVGNDLYTVGEASALTPVVRILQAFPWMMAVVTVMCCFLMAVLLQARLRRRARLRLQGSE